MKLNAMQGLFFLASYRKRFLLVHCLCLLQLSFMGSFMSLGFAIFSSPGHRQDAAGTEAGLGVEHFIQ